MVDTLERPSAWRNNSSLPLRAKTAIRTLYLINGHTPKEIETMGLGFSAQQVSSLAAREGWTKQRRAVASKVDSNVAARVDEAAKNVADALAMESEELCFQALNVTREGLTAGGLNGAKQAQAGSAALRNLHSVVQSIRKPEASDPGSRTDLTVFIVRADKQEAKQVHEVEAKRIAE